METDKTKAEDRAYMKRAIDLARRGEGWVHPNPMVGAVIVKDGKIIGEGYHQKYGQLHAERNAIASLRESGEGATMYVTLEPCCHYGKTPPCTEAILEQKIARVIIGSRDPNPKVAGKGAAILRREGVDVVEDFMRKECDRINPVFFHYITRKRPYLIMKYAMTADGKIATRTGASKWITGEASREEVQRLRHACMGIMVGIGTVLADDPLLNCRMEGGRQPVRIICDSHLRIPEESRICRTAQEYETILVCAGGPADKKQKLKEMGIRVLDLPRTGDSDKTGPGPAGSEQSGSGPAGSGQVDLDRLMDVLGQEAIDSILLEGGGILNDSALRAGIVQEIRAFIAPKLFGGQARSPVDGAGVEQPSQATGLKLVDTQRFGEDLCLRYLVQHNTDEGKGR